MTRRLDEQRPVTLRGRALPERAVAVVHGRREQEYYQSVLAPRRVTGHEGIGELFEYRIEAVPSVAEYPFSPLRDEDIDLAAIKGSPVTLTFRNIYRRNHSAQSARARSGDREIHGVIASADITGTEGGAVIYEFTLRPRLWFATIARNSRIFTAEQYGDVTNVLCEVLRPYQVSIDLRVCHSATPSRDFLRQAEETDWAFFMRLCEEFGYLIWFEHRDGNDVLVIADDIRACVAQDRPFDTLVYHPDGGFIDQQYVTDLAFRSTITLDGVMVHDHNYLSPRVTPSSSPYREQYMAPLERDESSPTGQPFEFKSYEAAAYAQPQTDRRPPQDDTSWHDDAKHLARVKLEAARGTRIRVQACGPLAGIEAARTLTVMDHPHDEIDGDYVVLNCRLDMHIPGNTSNAQAEPKMETQLELHPADEPYRMPQVTPRPKITSQERAIIVGWTQFKMSVDQYNRALIQYPWDLEGNLNGNTSIWVRLALPWQGDRMGAVMHARHQQEVLVSYVDGDPDRPIITAFLPNANNMPPWELPKNQALTGIVSRNLGDGGTTNHLALDDTRDQPQAQLASDHKTSSLSLGYITRIVANVGRQDARGEGFELRTDEHGVVRAALGLLLTTVARLTARGKVKEIDETVGRLTGARDIHESAAQQAQAHGAQNAQCDQTEVTAAMKRTNAELRGKPGDEYRNPFPEFEAPHLVLSSAADIVADAAHNAHFASLEHTAITAGGHVSIAAGKSLLASVRGAVSFFANKATTLIAGERFRIESQTDALDLIARKVVNILSEQAEIRLTARRIVLNGGGSELAIDGAGIVGHTNGQFLVHAATHETADPDAKPRSFPEMQYDEQFTLLDEARRPLANVGYRIIVDGQSAITGTTDSSGKTERIPTQIASGLKLQLEKK
jgi:type VI secretion system secreted protein VgrG